MENLTERVNTLFRRFETLETGEDHGRILITIS